MDEPLEPRLHLSLFGLGHTYEAEPEKQASS